jgi:hypothetical protein
MSSNKKRDMEASDDDDEYDEDYKDKGRLHDALLRKIGIQFLVVEMRLGFCGPLPITKPQPYTLFHFLRWNPTWNTSARPMLVTW